MSLTWREVLRFEARPAARSTVRRYYAAYRREICLKNRCDNSACVFHTRDPEWNGRPLPLILDHVDGINVDNRPHKLRYLCPNCDAQLETRGGRNKGRVTVMPGGFARRASDGKQHYTLVAEAGRYHIEGAGSRLSKGTA